MTTSTIKKLINLNTQFYNTVSFHFDDSRQYNWEGWDTLLTFIPQEQVNSLLDLGCGNGRFGMFAWNQFKQLETYTGVDNNTQLLAIAHNKLTNYSHSQLISLDILSTLQTNDVEEKLGHKKYDLIVLFGFIHHVPSTQLRTKLFTAISSLLTENGIFVFTTWQFMEHERLRKKISDPKTVGILPTELEKNDYILDWQRGESSFRYAHYFEPVEIKSLLENADLELIAKFSADGKEKNVNNYYICKHKV
jgi:tRNA (uracil-5-)-methyltransferase TRM9